MAAFIAKQMMGDQIKNVTGGDGSEGEGKKEMSEEEAEEAAAIEEARREMEEKRKEKHRKMEEEREELRQGIRDKYGLKKKEVIKAEPEEDPSMEGRLGRKKKTPAEMAAEAAKAEEEEENSFLPANVTELTSKVTELPGKVIAEASEKCVLQ